MSKAPEVALLVGAGDAIGAAVARRFAKGGYIVCIARRDGEKSKALAHDDVDLGAAREDEAGQQVGETHGTVEMARR